MKVLITGANGMLALDLQRQISIFTDWQIWSIGTQQLDITNEAQVRTQLSTFRPHILINCAAYTQVDRAEEEPELAQATNTRSLEYLAKSCQELQIKLVHLSTDFVFDGTACQPYQETDRPHPISVYGQTKYEGEQNVQAYAPNGLIVRTAWLFGQHGNNFVKTMLHLAQNQSQLRIIHDQIGSPTWTIHLADALIQLINQNTTGIVHFSSAGQCSWYEFARFTIERAFQLGMLSQIPRIEPIKTSEYPLPAKRPAYSVLACTRYQKLTSAPLPQWKSGVRAVLDQLRKKNLHQLV